MDTLRPRTDAIIWARNWCRCVSHAVCHVWMWSWTAKDLKDRVMPRTFTRCQVLSAGAAVPAIWPAASPGPRAGGGRPWGESRVQCSGSLCIHKVIRCIAMLYVPCGFRSDIDEMPRPSQTKVHVPIFSSCITMVTIPWVYHTPISAVV